MLEELEGVFFEVPLDH